jgi:hypothetical protein
MNENDSQPISPRQRLQALLAIPERQRTDAQWDELNELEIMLAPGNRPGAADPNNRRNGGGGGGGGSAMHSAPGGGRPHGKRPSRPFHKRPPKRNAR